MDIGIEIKLDSAEDFFQEGQVFVATGGSGYNECFFLIVACTGGPFEGVRRPNIIGIFHVYFPN
jgi:hypothetical protein